jgi:hypothetical protein
VVPLHSCALSTRFPSWRNSTTSRCCRSSDGQLVTKEELFAALWRDIIVSAFQLANLAGRVACPGPPVQDEHCALGPIAVALRGADVEADEGCRHDQLKIHLALDGSRQPLHHQKRFPTLSLRQGHVRTGV